MSGGASASSGSQSGTKTETIDAETKAFRDRLFGLYGDLTKNIPGFGGDNTGTFIAPESQDTKAYYDAVRGMQGGVNPNSATVNRVGQNLAGGNTITGGNVVGQDVVGGNVGYNDISTQDAYQTAIGANNLDPAYLSYLGGYDAAKTQTVDNARDLRGIDLSNPYQSKFLTDVVDPTLSEFDYQSAVKRNQMKVGRDASSAFGSRARNADAVYDAASDRDRALIAAGLRKDAFGTAIGAGMSDADRLVVNDRQSQQLEASRREGQASRDTAANLYAKDREYDTNRGNVAIGNDAQKFNIGNAIDMAKYNSDAAYRSRVDNISRSLGVDESNRSTRMANDTANINRSIGVQQNNADRNIGVQTGNINRSIGVQQGNVNNAVTGANMLGAQDQNDFSRTLTQLGLLGDSGASQTQFAQRKASEPLDLLGMAASIVGGVPYGGTTQSQGKSKSKTGSVTG
jgi:hypothetical protein